MRELEEGLGDHIKPYKYIGTETEGGGDTVGAWKYILGNTSMVGSNLMPILAGRTKPGKVMRRAIY